MRLIIGKHIELDICGMTDGVYIKLGSRDWWWCRED